MLSKILDDTLLGDILFKDYCFYNASFDLNLSFDCLWLTALYILGFDWLLILTYGFLLTILSFFFWRYLFYPPSAYSFIFFSKIGLDLYCFCWYLYLGGNIFFSFFISTVSTLSFCSILCCLIFYLLCLIAS